MISTTLYQTSGDVVGKSGFLNISVLKGGKVVFGAIATARAKLDSMLVTWKSRFLEISKNEV